MRRRPPRRSHSSSPVGLLLVAGTAVVAGAVFLLPRVLPGGGLDVDGPEDEALLGADEVANSELVARVDHADDLDEVELRVDGEDARDLARAEDRSLTLPLAKLGDGTHTVTAELDASFGRVAADERTVTVDTEAPEVALDDLEDPAIIGEPLVIAGTVDDPEAELRAEDAEVQRDGDRFTLTFEAAPEDEVAVEAVDAAGNRSRDDAAVAAVPSRVEVDELRSVHVSFHAWTSADLREPVLDMADRDLINSVQLDLKDESGTVGYDSEIDLAHEAGTVDPIYDLDEAVAELHDRGLNVVGRIVAFADPLLATAEWEDGDRDRVVQTAGGELYTGRYDGFTNFAHPDVREYNIEIAREAARAGVDDILWDYVRRPDGELDGFTFPGLETSPEESIVEFVAEADEALAPYGVQHGASVYGIAVDRPTQIAQDIEGMVEHLDYVAPMVYPSHWGPGEYGVEDPDSQPYDIVRASVEDFVEVADGSRAKVVPWLQDFSMGVTYGPDEVRAQIEATQDAGAGDEWLLWDSGVSYTDAALE